MAFWLLSLKKRQLHGMFAVYMRKHFLKIGVKIISSDSETVTYSMMVGTPKIYSRFSPRASSRHRKLSIS